MKRASLRAAILIGGLLWAAGALLLAAVGYFPGGGAWIAVVCSLAIVLMVAGGLTVVVGFLPLGRLSRRLVSVRKGASDRLDGSYPKEVQPLIDDLNDLLRRNREALERSRLEADNLAHGLKTPLTILGNELQRLAAEGEISTGDMRQQVEAMTAQVELHLGRARAAAAHLAHPPESTCEVLPSVERLTRTMRKLHQEKALEIEVDVTRELTFCGDREDLEEVLGNLLDNACKWARGKVVIGARTSGDRVTLTVEDDGPGLSELERTVLARGHLLGDPRPGGGIGLRLIQNVVRLYGGKVAFKESRFGGLRVVLELPSG